MVGSVAQRHGEDAVLYARCSAVEPSRRTDRKPSTSAPKRSRSPGPIRPPDFGKSVNTVAPASVALPEQRIGSPFSVAPDVDAAISSRRTPVHVAGLHVVLPKGRWLPRRGRTLIRFGGPIALASSTPYGVAATILESAERELAHDGTAAPVPDAPSRLPYAHPT